MKHLLLNLHEVVIALTILETLMLCIALGVLPGGRKPSRRLLQFFFILVIGTLTSTLVTWNASFQSMAIAHYPLLPALLSACLLLQGPVLFFYLRFLIKPSKENNVLTNVSLFATTTSFLNLLFNTLIVYNIL